MAILRLAPLHGQPFLRTPAASRTLVFEISLNDLRVFAFLLRKAINRFRMTQRTNRSLLVELDTLCHDLKKILERRNMGMRLTVLRKVLSRQLEDLKETQAYVTTRS